LETRHLEMTKLHEFQKYLIFSLEEQNKYLTDQINSQDALMLHNETINKLKLRERSILLVELAEQVNSLRFELNNVKKNKKSNILSKSLEVSSGTEKDFTEKSKSIDTTKSNDAISMLQVTRPSTVATRSELNNKKSSLKPVYIDKPLTAPLNETSSSSSTPILQTSFMQESKRSSMFKSSGGAQGKIQLNNTLKPNHNNLNAIDSIYSNIHNEQLIEGATYDFTWLGLENSKVAEIKNIRQELLKNLTEAMRLRKKHMMATTKALHVKGKGREAKLKLNLKSLIE